MWEKKTTKQLTDAERGYGPAHKKLRQQWENCFARGEDHACGQLVNPYEPWDPDKAHNLEMIIAKIGTVDQAAYASTSQATTANSENTTAPTKEPQ